MSEYEDKNKKVKEIEKNSSEKEVNEGTLFFLSFDIVNSTYFKNKYPSNWVSKIKDFYEYINEKI